MSTAQTGAAAPAGGDRFTALLTRARAGSGDALRSVYDSLAGEIAGYLRARGATDVGVATNEVFHRAFSRLDRFRGDESGFRSWVFKIAHNLLIDEHRKRVRRPQTVAPVDAGHHDGMGGDVEAEAIEALEADEVIAVLNRLTVGQRDVMFLRLIGGLSVRETAEVLEKPIGAIKSLQHRAIEALRNSIDHSAYPIGSRARSQS